MIAAPAAANLGAELVVEEPARRDARRDLGARIERDLRAGAIVKAPRGGAVDQIIVGDDVSVVLTAANCCSRRTLRRSFEQLIHVQE